MTVRRSGPGLATLTTAFRELDGIETKTGFFETAKYADGTPVATVAVIQEFGAITGLAAAAQTYQTGGGGAPKKPTIIPPRPFFRPTIAERSPLWLEKLGEGAAAVMAGKGTAVGVMDAVGQLAAAHVAQGISKVMTPPLAASTIARKGFSKPLVDSSKMITSVTSTTEKAR